MQIDGESDRSTSLRTRVGSGEVLARRVSVIGAGYVGLTTAACLASLGHRVYCVDKDPVLVSRLCRSQVSIREPGLGSLVAAGLTKGRLQFGVGSRAALVGAEVVFLCLPTPPGPGGAPDLSEIESAVTEIAGALPPRCSLVIKSTVPPGTAAKMTCLLGRKDVAVVSNPEFLREGSAVADFLRPARIVVGADTTGAAERILDLYANVAAPVVLTSTASAELAKYAANCFLAVKLSYINEIAELCERFDADIDEVIETLSYDNRIGASHLQPGPGWGGPCLPKDTQAMLHASSTGETEFTLLRAALAANERQHRRIADRTRWAVGGTLAGTRIGLLGLTFKASTNDLRNSPALAVAALLTAEDAQLTAYDPTVCSDVAGITIARDPYQAVTGAEAVVLLTDWPQFQELDWSRVSQLMTGNAIIDTRNHLNPTALNHVGLRWQGIGRGHDRMERLCNVGPEPPTSA